jgi:hypothetical protein
MINSAGEQAGRVFLLITGHRGRTMIREGYSRPDP